MATGTSGADTFTLSPSSNLVISGFDVAGQDVLGIPTGSGGFSLASYTGQSTLTMVDASAWWNGISGAQVVRWTGDLTAVDTAAEVDGLLQSMPGNGGGGRLFIGGSAGGGVGVYYDTNPAGSGGITQVASLEGVTGTSALDAADFKPGAASSGSPPTLSFQGSASAAEGNVGSTALSFTVTRQGDLSGSSSALWTVSSASNPKSTAPDGSPIPDGSAADADFAGGAFPSGTVNFAPGQSTAAITVNVAGDTAPEPNEWFAVRLSNVSGATLPGDSPAYGTIFNDDGGGLRLTNSAAHYEGDFGSTAYTYTVTRENAVGAASVSWAVGTGPAPPYPGAEVHDADASDFAGGAIPSGVLDFADGQTSAQFTVLVAGDTQAEPDEQFGVRLSNPVNSYIINGLARGLISNDDSATPPPGGGSGTGASGNDTFTLSPTANLAITGYDASGQDVLGIPTGSGWFSLAGYTGQSTLTMVDASAWWNSIAGAQVVRWTGDPTAADTAAEIDGLLQAMPGNGGGGVLFIADTPGDRIGVFYDSNPAAPGGITQVASLEGVTATTALNASDFKVGSQSTAQPVISVQSGNQERPEGDSGSNPFTINLLRTGDLSGTSTVNWAAVPTSPGHNDKGFTSSDDFVGGFPSGSVSFAPGQDQATIVLNVQGDIQSERDEVFVINLSSPAGATVSTVMPIFTIANDDGGWLSLSPVSQSLDEGSSGATEFIFTLERSGTGKAAASADWRVTGSGNDPVDGADFVGGVLPTGKVTFAEGQTSAKIRIAVAGDQAVERDEGFAVQLTTTSNALIPLGGGFAVATIRNDDGGAPGAATLSLSPGSLSLNEGGFDSTAFAYTVTRSGDLSAASTVNWRVEAGTGAGYQLASATDFAGSGLTMPAGQLSFAAGQSTAQITVNVAGDDLLERDEAFQVILSNPSGAAIGTGTAEGIIRNDEPAVSLTAASASISKAEGDAGSTGFTWTLTRSGDVSSPVTVDYVMETGSGTEAGPQANADDFVSGLAPQGRFSFAAGQATNTLTVNVAGDTAVEGDERFGIVVADLTVSGTILNDDGGSQPGGGVGTSGNDTFTLSPSANLTITGYDTAGQDVLGIPTGSGGFSLAAYAGGSGLTMVDASAWWNGIAGAQVVRWTGDPTAVDTVGEVDGLLQAMPGNGGGGRLFIGSSAGDKVSVYYDPDPTTVGNATLVATLDNLMGTTALTTADFLAVA